MGKLKIVYPICCGMDVHRDFVIACIAATNEQGVTQYQSRRFSTYSGGLRDLRNWLLRNNCKDVCMESTGKYWFPVHNLLETDCKTMKVPVKRKLRELGNQVHTSSLFWCKSPLLQAVAIKIRKSKASIKLLKNGVVATNLKLQLPDDY